MRSPPRPSQLAGARTEKLRMAVAARPSPNRRAQSYTRRAASAKSLLPITSFYSPETPELRYSRDRTNRTNCTRTPKPVHGLSELLKRSPAVRMHARDTAWATFCIGGVLRPVAPTFPLAAPPPLRPRCNAALVDFGSLGFAISQLRFHCSLALGYNNYSAKFKLTVMEFA